MKLAIMQPYLFPYIGYFQLIHAADTFIIYDDVQFIKEGWIHRNRLLVNGQSKAFTIPLNKDCHTALIDQRSIATGRWKKDRQKLLTMIKQSYGKAPYFKSTFDLVETCILNPENKVADFIEYALLQSCSYLGISTKIIRSSSLGIANGLHGQSRIIQICKELKATHYINAIGGQELYDGLSFSQESIALSFIKPKNINYPQFRNEFIPWLSIIDVMMFNPIDRIREFLDMHKLV